MNEREAWKFFETTGSVEAYLLYRTLGTSGKEPGNDLQNQGNTAADQPHSS